MSAEEIAVWNKIRNIILEWGTAYRRNLEAKEIVETIEEKLHAE